MLGEKILNKFFELTNEPAENTKLYFPNGKDSIRIRMADGSERIFTYVDDETWCLETRKFYVSGKENLK